MSHQQTPSMKRQSPLGHARNHGSAKDGTHHWIAQRFSAIALLLLGPWLLYNFYYENISTYEGAVAWLQNPGGLAFMVLLLVAGLYHAFLGLQVVVEDYVHSNWVKLPMLIGLNLLFALVGVMAVLSLVRIQNLPVSSMETDIMGTENIEKSSTALETL